VTGKMAALEGGHMAVESALVPLGTKAPEFALRDVNGASFELSTFDDARVLVVAFVCNHCPYVQHIETALGELANEVPAQFVAICSNDAVGYPDDAPGQLAKQAQRAGWSFPYLVDETQRVAQAYGAVCTPDFFVYDANRSLTYRGAFDYSTPKNGEPVDGSLLRSAILLTAAEGSVPEPHRPSLGCSIKWREAESA
jgi:peroxiredoxin